MWQGISISFRAVELGLAVSTAAGRRMVGSSGLAQRLARKEARLLKEERRGAGKCAGIPAQDLRPGREILAALVVALLLLAEAAADGRSFRRCRRVQPLSRRGLADQRARVNLAHARRAVG